MGETEPKLSDTSGIPGNRANGHSGPLVNYSYRNGQVVHYKLIGGDRGLWVGGSNVYAIEAKQIIAAFLLEE